MLGGEKKQLLNLQFLWIFIEQWAKNGNEIMKTKQLSFQRIFQRFEGERFEEIAPFFLAHFIFISGYGAI